MAPKPPYRLRHQGVAATADFGVQQSLPNGPALLTLEPYATTIESWISPASKLSKPSSTPLNDRDLEPFVGLMSDENERERQGLSLAAVARQIGVAASTIRRYEAASDAEADGVLAVVAWLETAPEDYIEGTAIPGIRLALPYRGHIRVDMELVANVEGNSGANGRTRTTIQRLVNVAQLAGRRVASLTRVRRVERATPRVPGPAFVK